MADALELIKSGLSKILGISDEGTHDTVNVSSSAIDVVEYDLASKGLTITFNSGSVYLYPNCPEEIYTELVNASSVGRYFVFNIRNGLYGINYIRLN